MNKESNTNMELTNEQKEALLDAFADIGLHAAEGEILTEAQVLNLAAIRRQAQLVLEHTQKAINLLQ